MRLDPQVMTRRWAIDWAGSDGQSNLANYPNCEYSEKAIAQSSATSPEDRRTLVNEVHAIMSEDVGLSSVLSNVLRGAYNTELVEIGGLGETGIHNTAPYPLLKSTPKQGNRLVVNASPSFLRLKNYYKRSAGPAIARLNAFIHSPLAEYDENFELVPVLREDGESTDQAQQFDVTLRSTTFSNGDPVTAEDVKYTFDHVWGNVGVYPYADPPEGYSIETTGERSLSFSFGSPQPRFISTRSSTTSRPIWPCSPYTAPTTPGSSPRSTTFPAGRPSSFSTVERSTPVCTVHTTGTFSPRRSENTDGSDRGGSRPSPARRAGFVPVTCGRSHRRTPDGCLSGAEPIRSTNSLAGRPRRYTYNKHVKYRNL